MQIIDEDLLNGIGDQHIAGIFNGRPDQKHDDANGNKIMPDSACDCWSLGVILYIMVSVDAYICTRYADISIYD